MTVSPHTHRIPVQGQAASSDALVAPVPTVVSVNLGVGATPLLPRCHPANSSPDSPVVRWTHRLATMMAATESQEPGVSLPLRRVRFTSAR